MEGELDGGGAMMVDGGDGVCSAALPGDCNFPVGGGLANDAARLSVEYGGTTDVRG